MKKVKCDKSGFTIIEVMVAMSLIMMAVTFTTPYIALQIRRVKAMRMQQEASYCARRIVEYFMTVDPVTICAGTTQTGSLPDNYHSLDPDVASVGIEKDLVDFLGNPAGGTPDVCVRSGGQDPPGFKWKIEPKMYCNSFEDSGVLAVCAAKLEYTLLIRYTLPELARMGAGDQEVEFTSTQLVFDRTKIAGMFNNGSGCDVPPMSDCLSDNCKL